MDFTARVIAPKLSEALGQPVVVENRVGAGGNIAAEFIAKAPPTGHALLIAAGPIAINVTLYKKLPFDTRKDLAPIAFIASAPNMLVAGPRTKAASVAELIDYARLNPGKLNFASNAVGSSQHLSAELLKYYAKFSAVHVPYRGLPAAVAAVVTGEVDFMFDAVPTGLPYVRAGKTRVLAVASRSRSRSTPKHGPAS
ncbi:MAG: hypothetical protein HYU75_09765 [Betaproteobacteria bacterium]|nr:hypothetical protein [Betaproteobacteria bacterium]